MEVRSNDLHPFQKSKCSQNGSKPTSKEVPLYHVKRI